MLTYDKKKLRIENVKFFVLQFLLLVNIRNIILKLVPLGLKHFHDLFSSPKYWDFLKLLVVNYLTLIFEKH